jgi:hypothetical protein
MTTDYTEPTTVPPAAPASEPATKNSFQRIVGVLFAPTATFQDIARRPDIIVPLLAIVLISFVTIAATFRNIDFESMIAQQQEVMREKNPNMSAADFDRVAKFSTAITKVGIWLSPFLIIIGFVVISGILLLSFRLFGGEGNFKQAFSATLYSWMPRLVGGIIGTIVVLARGKVDLMELQTIVKSNPAFLVDAKEQPVLFALLTNFDLFGLWSLVLLIIGFAALARVSKAKSAVIVLSLWVILVLVKLAFAAMGAGMQS